MNDEENSIPACSTPECPSLVRKGLDTCDACHTRWLNERDVAMEAHAYSHAQSRYQK